jgi:hypothetical protein
MFKERTVTDHLHLQLKEELNWLFFRESIKHCAKHHL